MSQLRSKNLPLELSEILSDRIIRMELKAGDRILEAKVAREFSVSQSTVREALRIMERSGLVEISQRRGTYVTQLSADDVAILYDIIADVYALLIRRAMERRSEVNVKRVLDVIKKVERAAEKSDVDAYYRGIFEFAMIAIDAVGSPVMRKTISDLWPSKRRVEYLTLKQRRNDLKNNLKYFKLLEKQMLASEIDQLVKTIKEYTRNEKDTALAILAKTTPL